MVHEVALEQVFSRFFDFPLQIIIPPLLHSHLSPPHEVDVSPEQAACYYTLGPKLGASSVTRYFPGLWVKWFTFIAEMSNNWLMDWNKTEQYLSFAAVNKFRELAPRRRSWLVAQLVKKFYAVYGTWIFITVFTRAHQLTLSWVKWIQTRIILKLIL